MILESLVTTLNEDGSVNVAPMGPRLAEGAGDRWARFELRPFDSSQTLANLLRHGAGVMHVHDDVELFARAAIGQLDQIPETVAADEVEGRRLVDACRAYEFRVAFSDLSGARKTLQCETKKVHRGPDFFGFNRGMHAVLEAAILATRVDFLPAAVIADQFATLQRAVEKTGGPREHRAFELLRVYITPTEENVTGA